MSRKTTAFLALLFICPVLFHLLWPSDEGRIRKLFREGASAVEAGSPGDVMSKVSFSYSDEHGLTYLFLKEGLTRMFKELNGIRVEYEIKGIEVKDERATAEIDARLIARQGRGTYIAGDAERPLHVKFFLEKEHARWLVVRTEGLPAGFFNG